LFSERDAQVVDERAAVMDDIVEVEVRLAEIGPHILALRFVPVERVEHGAVGGVGVGVDGGRADF
jgi:hypothetical protein